MLDRPADARAFLDAQREHLSPGYSTFHLWIAMRAVHTFLYLNEGRSAVEYMERELPRFNASACARGRFFATTMRYLHARSCLAAATPDASDRRALISQAEQNAIAIRKTRLPHAQALSLLLLAEVAWKTGRPMHARDLLTTCVDKESEHQASMFASYAQRSLGRLLGGDEGADLVQKADGRLRQEGIQVPAHWARIWIGDHD
jgi:hypothetical protein